MRGSLRILARKFCPGTLKEIKNKMSKAKTLSVIYIEKINKRGENVK